MRSEIIKGGMCGPTILLLLSGCAQDNAVVEQDYGIAVRHMIAVQTANPGSSAYGLDGQKAALTLDKYRRDVANPKDVDKEGLTGSAGVSASGGTSNTN